MKPSGSLPPETLSSAVLRLGIFTVLIFGMILVIWWLAGHHGLELFFEGSPLEWVQFSMLLASSAISFITGWRVPAFRPLLLLLGVLPLLAAVRELDKDFDLWLPLVGWQLPFVLVLGSGALYGFKNRHAVIRLTRLFILHRSFGILWGGFIVAIPFAQMVGHGDFLRALYDQDYHRSMRAIIEECSELIGYLILLLGVCDWSWHLIRACRPACCPVRD